MRTFPKGFAIIPVARAKIAVDGGKITLVLLSAPGGMEYDPRAGLEKFDHCFGLCRTWKTL